MKSSRGDCPFLINNQDQEDLAEVKVVIGKLFYIPTLTFPVFSFRNPPHNPHYFSVYWLSPRSAARLRPATVKLTLLKIWMEMEPDFPITSLHQSSKLAFLFLQFYVCWMNQHTKSLNHFEPIWLFLIISGQKTMYYVFLTRILGCREHNSWQLAPMPWSLECPLWPF